MTKSEMNAKSCEIVKEMILNAEFDDYDQVKIDFADIATDTEIINVAAELGFCAEHAQEGQGVWWIYK